MDVRNCRQCGRMFNYIGQPLCPQCMSALEDKFQEVKCYIEEHPGASITQVAEETEVSAKQLRRWVREERLSFSDASLVGLNCEGCGAMIRTGRFCENCKASLSNSLANSIRPQAQTNPFANRKRESARMHYLDGQN